MNFSKFISFLFFLICCEQIHCLKLKWGILSAGRISNDFILSLNNFKKEDHEVVSIASTNKTKAMQYAARFNISTYYGNYQDLANDPNVNAVYVATINPYHFAAIKLMLENKKHVLAEKPLIIHPEDARELFRIAKENSCFLMEALWSRFLPAYEQATEMINNGTIGEIEHISSHHLLTGANIKRLSNIKLGGSTTLDIGIYSLHAILTAVNFTRPIELKVVGKKLTENSTDSTVAGVVKFPNQVTGSFVMTFNTSKLVNEKLSEVVYIGTEGYIKLGYPMNGPDSFELNGKRIEARISDDQTGYNWETSAGLRFQAEHFRKEIEKGKLVSDKMPPEYSYLFADLNKEIYSQLNVTLPPTITTYDFKRIN